MNHCTHFHANTFTKFVQMAIFFLKILGVWEKLSCMNLRLIPNKMNNCTHFQANPFTKYVQMALLFENFRGLGKGISHESTFDTKQNEPLYTFLRPSIREICVNNTWSSFWKIESFNAQESQIIFDITQICELQIISIEIHCLSRISILQHTSDSMFVAQNDVVEKEKVYFRHWLSWLL